MCWKKLKYSTRGGIISTIIGIIGWAIYFFIPKDCSGEFGCFYLLILFFIALLSIIVFWLLGLLIGGILSKEKEITGLGYFFIILGIIIILFIVYYVIHRTVS